MTGDCADRDTKVIGSGIVAAGALGDFQYNDDDGRMFNLDPPSNTRIRRILAPALSRQQIQRRRTEVEGVIDALVEAVEAAREPVDLVSRYTSVIPEQVMFRWYGIPDADTQPRQL